MRDQLRQYVDLLFAGIPNAEDIKQEILQNTLDRYDDLIDQGKTPEAAYQLAISGIGDINEILSSQQTAQQTSAEPSGPDIQENKKSNKLVKAFAVALFILCPVPVLIFENVIGVCLLLVMVAAGVAILTAYGKEEKAAPTTPAEPQRSAINRGITGGIWAAGLSAYFLLSFSTGDWHVTWLIFPILGCICGLIDAIFDVSKRTASAIIRMIVFSLLIVILAGCVLAFYLGFHFLSNADFGPTDGNVESVGSVDAAAVRDIQIEWVSGSITIEPADVDTITFAETSGLNEDDKMVWKQSGEELIIQFSKPRTFLFFSFGNTVTASKDLVIKVPQDWICDELDIESVSAEINISGIQASDIDMENVSGECSITNCTVDSFSSETVSGSVDFSGQLNKLDLNSVSADCTAYLTNSPKEIQLECVSGDLTLYLPETCGFTVSQDAVSGHFNSEFSTTSSGGDYIYGDGSCRITADGISGDITIRKAN